MQFNYLQQPGRLLTDRFDVTEIKPFISVITAYYNASKYFEQTYRSVLNQTFPYFEWIIVDDGSTQPSEFDFLESISKTDPRISLYHISNGGAAAARNFGVEKSTTEIFIPVDADDLLEPTFFEYLYFALRCHSDAAWAYTASVAFGEQEYIWNVDFTSDIMKIENVACITSAIRKNAFEEVGGYIASSKNLYEDWKLWLRLLEKRYYPIHIKSPLFWYRRLSSGALSSINNNEILKQTILKEIKQLADKVPDGILAKTFDDACDISFDKPKKWDWDIKLKYKKEKTRILLLIPHMERGGADKFNVDILSNIDKDKYEIGVITTLKSKNEWQQLFTQHAQDVFVLSDFLDRNDWSAFIHYYIYSRDVDIVMNISSYLGYAFMPWLRKEFPTIGLIDCVHAEGKYWRNGGYPRKSAAVDSILEKTFATNEYTRQIMISSYGKKPEKIETIYTGVDENYFSRTNISESAVKDKLGIESTRPVILYLCRICNEKRPFLMLEIADKLRKIIPDICFLVVGDGPLLAELKQKVYERNLESTIYIADKQEDIRPYYAASDLFLICSIKEGLAITTFEAMLMELPVISSDVGGQKELVSQETGRLVPCLQDEKLDFDSRTYIDAEINYYVDAIVDLLSGKYNLVNMGKMCRKKVLSGFTLTVMIKKIEAEFDRLKSGDGMDERIRISNALSVMPDVIDDYLTISSAHENAEYNHNIAWNYMSSQIFLLQNLRSYKLSIKYHNLVNTNFIFNFFDKCLRFSGRCARKIYRIIKS